jgi:hypothetical protein
VGTVDTPSGTSTLATLSSGATTARAYVGVDNNLSLGGTPVVATTDLVGGSQIELEVVTADSSPVRFEVWSVGVDGTATLEAPVDAQSGFALQSINPKQDGTWAVFFEGGQTSSVIVHMDCTGGLHGCAQLRQPGETCPAGWTCDEGLACQLPIGVCGPLAGVGRCVAKGSSCAEGAAPVCGCDGQTYASECAARVAGASVLQVGACEGDIGAR